MHCICIFNVMVPDLPPPPSFSPFQAYTQKVVKDSIAQELARSGQARSRRRREAGAEWTGRAK